jgi:hypothetical protein
MNSIINIPANPPHTVVNNQTFKHRDLYQFWQRSQGLWLSKLVKINVRFLKERELQIFRQNHSLEQPEFGVRIAWEYRMKAEVGQMLWCVDSAQPHLVFTNQGFIYKGITAQGPPTIHHYQVFGEHTLITLGNGMEESTSLKGDSCRLRELRSGGALVRRIWETRFEP